MIAMWVLLGTLAFVGLLVLVLGGLVAIWRD